MIEAESATVLTAADSRWPAQVNRLPDPPKQVWLDGREDILAYAPTVAVVGARACTEDGARTARKIAEGLAQVGVTVVAGGALGIDTAAHIGALGFHGPTIAVMPCGLDVTYPPSNRALFTRIRQDGLMVSEYPTGSLPRRERFLRRNQIIAALADVLVVVEGGARSGTRSAARWAGEVGAVVAAVPPVVDRATALLPRELLAGGAVEVRSAADVLEVLGKTRANSSPI